MGLQWKVRTRKVLRSMLAVPSNLSLDIGQFNQELDAALSPWQS